MTTKEKVLQFLKEIPDKVHTPTEIGIAIGKDYNSASSCVSPILKKLEQEGVVRISKVGRVVTVKLK